MEFAAASFEVVLDKVTSMISNKVALICNADDELKELERSLGRVRTMLDHVENHVGFMYISRNEALKMWLQDVNKFSYDADDLLDEISLYISRKYNSDHDLHNDHKINQVRHMILSSPTRFGIPNKIKKIKDSLSIIANDMNCLWPFMPKLAESGSHMVTAKSSSSSSYFCITSSHEGEGGVVGRDDEIIDIIDRLLAGDTMACNISVIPIVGMGGIGKTTVAQVVYNDYRVVDGFNLRMWVSVSSNFDVSRITKSIIESATETSCNVSDLHALQAILQKLIAGKKLLLVLDDFWSEKDGDWDVLFSPLKAAGEQSKVIVTTRSVKVASIISRNLVQHLKPLNDNDCWELMKQKAFSNWNLEERDNLTHIGRDIARKCKGLPLAAKTLGSVLHFKSTVQEWILILESELWDLPEDKNDVFQSLAISYHYLPGHLKKCFAYCSIFPQKYEFQMDEMVLLWMAEGFIRPRGKIRLEDIGNEYFMDLAWRSFFQTSHTSHFDGTHTYVMHDLIHDMARLVSSGTCVRKEYDLSSWHHEFKHARHLSLQLEKNTQPIPLKASKWYDKLRTFLVMCETSSVIVEEPYEIFLKLKSIRVLNLSGTDIDELPGFINNLKHLRYLNLSKTDIQKLPEPITELCALQTLKLNDCRRFLELPTNFNNLIHLRHLDLDIKHRLNDKGMPSGLGRLSNLQTLSAFIVGSDEGRRISELKNMKFLRGSICIRNLENVSNVAEAREALLHEKPYLEKLELEWQRVQGNGDQQLDILESLKPHENVKTLGIKEYSAYRFPDWLSDPLCKLTSIHLQSCQNCIDFPSLGQLPFLKSLHVRAMPSVVSLDAQFSGHGMFTAFPMLEVLTFEGMQNLVEWTELNADDMPRLHELIIMDCPRLIGLPPLHNLNVIKKLSIADCPNLQSLPEGGLPGSLQSLIILHCPIIRDRCKVGEGEDWEKIRTVRKVEIDYQVVVGLGI